MVASGGGNQTSITLIGNSDLGAGGSTGQGIGLDANNIQLLLSNLSTGGKFTMNPSASGNQAFTAINVPNSSVIVGGGGGSPLAGQGGQWFEIPDRLVLVPHTGNNLWARNNRMSFKNDANSLIIYGSDDATPRFTFQHSTGGSNAGLLSLTSLRVGVNPAQVGGTSGDIGIRNSGALWGRNAANSADIPLIFLNSSDQIQLGSSSSHALKISGQINSTITSGTAPFVVASTTQVANLNASQLVGKTWAIPDPIGATTPAAITGTTVAANTSVTIGGGTAITMVISATASLDFPTTTLSTCSDLTMTVTGAAAGDPVFLGAPSASVPGGGSFFAWVSAANTVTVRFCADGTARDPAGGAFRAAVVKF
jgi:hypothetical protein